MVMHFGVGVGGAGRVRVMVCVRVGEAFEEMSCEKRKMFNRGLVLLRKRFAANGVMVPYGKLEKRADDLALIGKHSIENGKVDTYAKSVTILVKRVNW